VHVVSDRLAELGAEDGERFLTLEELELPGESEFVNLDPPSNSGLEQLPAVTGITVNTVHGDERTIAAVTERFGPQVESMEGAAFMSACLIHKVPFAQVRAVSNFVGRRNREAWKMPEAIQNLGVEALRIINQA
jgi:futalosine hydrolase